MLLDNINNPNDLKSLSVDELSLLSGEIRDVIIKKASIVGGHLASNLGSIELIVALHYVFNFLSDRIVFDVSHQCYTHKILTGRKKAFLEKESYDSVTGFTNPLESEYDLFNIGHTSTSLSLAIGLAKARDLRNSKENIVAFIGDAALSGGEAFEALNYLSELRSGMIIVLNDNHMSIPENHGFIDKHLQKLYLNNGVLNNNFFESFGIDYCFVKDGHNIKDLIKVFEKVKCTNRPIIVHCRTTKGKGFIPAELDKERWHHAHPFDLLTGEVYKQHSVPTENYGSIVGEYLESIIKHNKKVVAMTASVPACFGFNKKRREELADNFIDVGICEQHLITMAAGLSKGGMRPVVITESSFYQRAYDQIEQEISINSCPVTFLIAFSGIYGHDDNTHIGFYDISLFGNLNNIIFLAPTNKQMYLSMLRWSINESKKPVFIRIPWNGVYSLGDNELLPSTFEKTRYIERIKGEKVAIIALGSFYQLGERVAGLLKKHGIQATLVDPVFASGIDSEYLNSIKLGHDIVVTLEDGLLLGGFGSKIAQFYSESSIKVLNFGFSNNLSAKFSRDEIMERDGLTPEKIAKRIIGDL